MPNVHTRYVTYIRGGARRLHPGTATQDIVMPLSTVTPTGGTYQAWASPMISWSDANGSHSANFAFWAVTGAADGASITTNQSLSVQVGGTDVQAVAWYLPSGVGGTNGPALLVDAFDVDTGWFLDDDFVTVTSNPALSANANQTGVVPTASGAVDVQAFASVESVPFLEWIEFAQPAAQVISTENLHADQGTTVVAFAFYKSPAPVSFTPPRVPAEGTWVSWGVTVDAGGPTGAGPVPPWTPFVAQLAMGLALAETVGKVDASLQAEVAKIAATQVQIAARNIMAGIEQGIG